MIVFLDVAGTLIRVRGGVGAQYAAVARRFGVHAEPAALERAFPAAFRAAPPMAFPGAPAHALPDLEREVWRGIVRRVFEAAGLLPAFAGDGFEAYFAAVFAHFEDPAVWEVFPDVPPALEALRARGATLGVISNFDARVLTLLDGLGLAPWFASVTLSRDTGAAKPDRAIFARALARHGASAAEALHVGDSLAEDYEGARAAGLGAVLLDRAGRHAGRGDVRRIATLTELDGVLGSGG